VSAGQLLRTDDPIRAVRVYRMTWAAVMAVCYIAVGLWLSHGKGVILGDALSRVADARFVLFSRDPHLAAMGFVFTPLTTFVELPLVAVMEHWPSLLAHDVPGIVVSAIAMSLAVLQIAGTLRDRRVGSRWIVAVCAMVALHPMIVFYAANGMSEALFLLFMAICTRGLLRWMASDDVHDLALVGIGLALGFLVRYDALAVGIGSAVVVAGTTLWRTRSTLRMRAHAMAMDVAIVVAPIATAFLLWSAVSWLTTGDALAQFTSDYGNTTILALSGGSGHDPLYRAGFEIIEWLALEPMIFVIIAVAAVWTAVRRVPDALPALVVYGAVLGFQAFSYFRGDTFGFLRFAITAIPLAGTLVGMLRPRQGLLFSRRAGPAARLQGADHGLSRSRRLASWAAVVGLLLPGVLIAPVTMSKPQIANQEYAATISVLGIPASPRIRLAVEAQQRTFRTERDVARYLDDQQLPAGSVITDTLFGYAVVAASSNPRQFVIPSDSDFVNALNDPAAHHVRYLLTVPDSGRGTTDAINRRYPTIYANGADAGILELEFPNSGSDQPAYRLYRVRSTA